MNTRLRCPSERTRVICLRCWNGRVLTPTMALSQPWQELVAAGIGRLHSQRHLPEAEFSEFLAVAQPVDVDRWEEGDDGLGLAQAHHLPKMRHQVEVSEPGEQRPPGTAERNAVEPRIGDGHRLHGDRLVVTAQLS